MAAVRFHEPSASAAVHECRPELLHAGQHGEWVCRRIQEHSSQVVSRALAAHDSGGTRIRSRDDEGAAIAARGTGAAADKPARQLGSWVLQLAWWLHDRPGVA